MRSQLDMFENLEKDFEKSYNLGVEAQEKESKNVTYENFKKELKTPKKEDLDKTVAYNASEINTLNKNKIDSIENIKTFFSE